MKLGEKVNAAELAEAWQGFCRWLRWKGFSWQFIRGDGVDMFAQAQLELSQALAGGVEIRSPPGWLVHCALQRQRISWRASASPFNDLGRPDRTAQKRRFDSGGGVAEDEQRHSLRDAISSLRPPEREIIELVYFDEMSCRAAARALGWSPSKANRNHHRALGRLAPILRGDRNLRNPGLGA